MTRKKQQKELRVIIIGNTDEDADWILDRLGRQKEMTIHDKLARDHQLRSEKKS